MEVRIQKLLKKYNQKTILDILDMHFKEGTIIGLLGDNGAGKSTLLKIISGIEKDYEGQILYNGYPLKDCHKQRIGMVSQKPYLFKRSVFENIEYPLKIRKIEKKKRKEIVDGYLREMNLEAIKGQRADTLSGGEAQKVALARALAAAPKLLLLDETTANIHEEAACAIETQLKSYHEQMGCTIIFVTHNLTQAERFCDECVWIK
ncbi:MAG: pstB1 [Clostridia bacterium]|jgi:tungstate transport system ATP-binding protein|nr:pstB1 [Clostridia bacterium]